MLTKKIRTRITAIAMAGIMGFLLPGQPLSERKVFAAEDDTRYIKEVKLYCKTGGKISDAENWCKSQAENKDDDKENDWHVLKGDLNDGAEGALKKAVAVYFCYQTTPNSSEAITDLAVMNEKGNYSEGAYEQMLKDEQDTYIDMVNDMKDMLSEYRENYKNNVPTAVTAHDFLNMYIEDDSQKLLGNLLLDISDEDLVKVLLQSNGQVVLAVQEQLASACDTNKVTWLDRLGKIGSFDALRKKFLKAYKNDANKADKALKEKYGDKATELLASWDDVKNHIDSVQKYEDDNEISKMSADDYNKWVEEKSNEDPIDNDFNTYYKEKSIVNVLMLYKYEDGTLYDYFDRSSDDVSGDNIKVLYPLVASLTEGQHASLNQTVSLFSLIMMATNQTINNGGDAGLAKEVKENLDKEDSKTVKEMQKETSEVIDEIVTDNKISVYEGVDRTLFDGGVAVTSNAENYANSSGKYWADSFVESGGLLGTAIALGVCSLGCVAGAVASNVAFKKVFNQIVEEVYKNPVSIKGAFGPDTIEIMQMVNVDELNDMNLLIANKLGETATAAEKQTLIDGANTLRSELFDKGISSGVAGSSTARLLYGLKIGFTVFAIVLAVADIVMSVITLYKYYHRDHLPIPNHMVDMTYNEDKEKSFIDYKSVRDTDGGCGDVNGGGGKQWLALYYTKDLDAGDPILAPDKIFANCKVTTGKYKKESNFDAVHMFGEPNVAQNLTFADGEDGYSYNDDNGGTYLSFTRGSVSSSNAASSTQTGTIISGPSAVTAGVTIFIFGIILGVIGSVLFKREDELIQENIEARKAHK
ncbi:MAG: hypothetical protein K6F77_07605 [Lachnospiraceae bacterium]|nr:hypothetical protein [Lachnospiraceae bacterium]